MDNEVPSSAKPLPEYTVTTDDPSTLTEAVRPYFDQQQPLVLRGLLSACQTNQTALTNFADWDFWEQTVDDETECHVELGGNYASTGNQTADVPFVEFLAYLRFFEQDFGRSPEDNHDKLLPKQEPEAQNLIYLAQNDLFEELKSQVEIPQFTQTLGQQGELYSTMIWMGPYGCVSPFHYDPLDNLLMQYVGAKQFLLCPPSDGWNLPPGTQPNTSSWDPYSNNDSENKEIMDKISLQHGTLYPGDAIYMPSKWFHHVKTIETSVSVNSWFR